MIEFKEGNNLIMFSGGLDSTLLLYLHLKQIKKRTYVLTLNVSLKGYKNKAVTDPIISYMGRKFGRSNIEHFVLDTDRIDSESVTNLLKPYKHLYPTPDYIYSGTTKNPDDFDLRISGLPERNTEQPQESIIENVPWIKPFVNLDKRDIYEIYKQEGILDLIPMTRSCEWFPDMDENVSDPGMGHCGECWWCKERKWGLKEYFESL